MKVGTPVLTASDRPGTVAALDWQLTGYELIAFDSGERYWIRADLLRPRPPDWKPQRKQARAVQSA